MKDKFDKIEPVTTAHHLSTKELAGLVSASTKQRALFKPLLDARKLLHHVVRGEHDAVKAMLTQDITLLFKKSIVTDCSGRIFEPISPFEYALWALDKHMWDTMLTCVPQNEKGNKVLAQLHSQYKALHITENALEEKEEKPQIRGLTYRLNGKVITEPHFDFKNTIIKELKTQVDSVNAPGPKDWGAIDKQWREGVGSAQRLLPVHVVNEYCAPAPFNPLPAFNSYPGSSKQFHNWLTGGVENWFKGDSRLGIDFSIYKAGEACVPGCSARAVFGLRRGGPDLVAMTALCKVRTKDFINLEPVLVASPKIDNNRPLAFHI